MLGKSDPYLVLKLGQNEVKTKVASGANPSWGENFEFNIGAADRDLTIELYDKETLSGDKLLASTTIQITEWIAKGVFDGDIPLKEIKKGGPGGLVKVQSQFKRVGAPTSAPGNILA
jgi:Ca2+-dependent lipid-binding protein